MKSLRTLLVIVLIIAVLLLIKFIFIPSTAMKSPSAGSNAPSVPVSGYIVRGSVVIEDIYATGSIIANEEVELHPEMPGKLMQILFKEGSKVNKGELLIKINDADIRAQLLKTDLDIKLAEDRIKRNEKLVEMKGISAEEFEGLKNVADARKADRDLLSAQLAKTEIHAPFSGLIGLKTVSEGSYVTPQTLIASLQQIDPVKIDFSIPEKYASLVKKGDEISFVSGDNTRAYKGTIYATEPKVDPVTRTVHIRALCPNANGEILPGAFAKITLHLGTINKALMIPSEAIIPILKGKQVFVYQDGKAAAVKVETGMRNDSTIQITNGLNENDTVIITGMMSLRPGVAVKLTSVN